MKTNSRILLLTVLTLGLFTRCTVLSDNIKPSKNYITRNYKVKEFNKIDASTVGNISFTQSADKSCTLQIYGPDNIVSLIQASVKDNTLILTTEKQNRIKNAGKIKISIIAPNLNAIHFKGVGDINIESELSTQSLEIESKGVGDIKLEALNCKTLSVSSMGVGNIKLQGIAEKASLASKGVGDIEAENLKAASVEASSEGVGNISCYATESLSASAKGIGSIKYGGSPKEKNIRKSGIGTIKAL
ncbi:head GIN domain-containing protein [uncultured Bacteroides sp.]|uniref:head GIN domain-containing protein n=1 Tax=uncultured Bacteroides sp. TaxID=162156 RepID=UPI002AA72EB2|nr:head GIN domain-containing protein [uncultured Bacteroides sp.]